MKKMEIEDYALNMAEDILMDVGIDDENKSVVVSNAIVRAVKKKINHVVR